MLLAEKLLTTLYELEDLEAKHNWEEELLKDNPPRYLRFRQIKAILKYIGYNDTPRWFLFDPVGDLSEDLQFELIEKLNLIPKPVKGLERFLEIGDVQATFLYLYKFRRHLHNSFNVLILSEGLGNYSIGENILRYLKYELPKEIAWVDEMLFLMVDPARNLLDIPLLVEKYDYPDVDLYEIDGDWI